MVKRRRKRRRGKEAVRSLTKERRPIPLSNKIGRVGGRWRKREEEEEGHLRRQGTSW